MWCGASVVSVMRVCRISVLPERANSPLVFEKDQLKNNQI